jgi:hypothetical protein
VLFWAREEMLGLGGASGRLECKVGVDELNRFGQGRGAKAEGTLDNSGLAANVISDVKG